MRSLFKLFLLAGVITRSLKHDYKFVFIDAAFKVRDRFMD